MGIDMRLQSLDVGVAQGDFFPVEALELRLIMTKKILNY